MCFTWRSAVWLHRRLPFGCRSSCLHAQRVTEAVVAIFRARTGKHIDGYVDDMVSVITKILSASAYAYFHWLCDYLGLEIALEKCMTPDVIRLFLGLLYNLVDMIMTLPEEKLHRVLHMLNEWLDRETCTKAQTQSLLGHLNHLTAVVHAGRPFTARVVDLLREATFPAKITDELKQDIRVWIQFLTSEFSCSSIIKSQDLAPPDETLCVAVNGQTFVIQCNGHASAFELHRDMPYFPNPVMHAIAVWKAGHQHVNELTGKVVKVSVPTKAAAVVVNRAKTHINVIRPMIRDMWMCQARNDFMIKAVPQTSHIKQTLYSTFHDFQTIKVPLK